MQMTDEQAWPTVTIRRETFDGVCVLHVAGELDMAGKGQLASGAPWEHDGVRHVVIDLSGLDFMDSTGLAEILSMKHAAQEARGVRVTVRGAPPHIRRVFELTGLSPLLDD